ncbi:MAG: 2-C-methyl-D-erythritol 4-phosphate cytidylyltransferase [Cyanothece sp. SIO2G6]|nr:2-C-methyl-D-erythritol 4-phosphate cytidylyltransferase [Cyanothece sp. SIO2G6]
MHILIPAAGKGTRMGSDRNKLLLSLLDQTILAWTLKAAAASPSIQWIGIMGQPYDFPAFQTIIDTLALATPITLIQGGATRQESVYRGLCALPNDAEYVLIHDGARCLATADLFERCAAAFKDCNGFIAAIPVKDTIKVVTPGTRTIEATPDRSQLWAAQTPQGFHVPTLKQCHQQGQQNQWQVTDDAALFEKCGLPVQIVTGEETNLKVTTPVDLAIAEFIVRSRLST